MKPWSLKWLLKKAKELNLKVGFVNLEDKK
jgi:hypothetical protein